MALSDLMERFFDAPEHIEFFRASALFFKSLIRIDISPYTAAEIDAALLIFTAHAAILFYLWLTRSGIRQDEAVTGRFATRSEMTKYYVIPAPFEFYFTRIGAVYLIPLFVLCFSRGEMFYAEIGIGISTIIILLLIGRSSWLQYDRMKSHLRFYPLGKWQGRKVGITGGNFKNIFGITTRKYQRQEHILIIGPTGAGKTSTFFIPGLIEDAFHSDSAMVIDIKPEEDLVERVGPIWNSQGKKVISFNVWKEDVGLHFNPLYHLEPDLLNPKTHSTLATLVDTIYRVKQEMIGTYSSDASHFIDQEKQLIHGLMFAALLRRPEERNLLTVAEALSGTIEQAIAYIAGSISIHSQNKEAEQLYRELSWFLEPTNMDMKRKAEMLSGAAKKLSVFRNPYVRRHMLRPELDLDLIFREPSLLVVKAPLAVHTDADMLASMITRLIMVKIYQTATDRLKRNHNIWLYLDELPSLKIPVLSNFVATVRSSGGGVIAAVQEKADLHSTARTVMSANSAEALETNFGTTILLPGCHPDTCERISLGVGDKMVLDKSKIQEVFQFVNFRTMKRYIKAPLVTADSLKYFHDGHAFILPNRKRPFWVKTEPYFQNKRYMKLLHSRRPVEYWKPEPLTPVVQYKPGQSDRDTKIDEKMQAFIESKASGRGFPPSADIGAIPANPNFDRSRYKDQSADVASQWVGYATDENIQNKESEK
ncbi:MAG: type IV secretory system conjugative DNA transfer family protein [Nitrospiria bacterium]